MKTFAMLWCAVLGCAWALTALPADEPVSDASPKNSIDPSVKPGDDFFQYANGMALATLQIPPDASSNGAFRELALLTERRNHELFEAAVQAAPAPATNERRVADYYAGFMDAGHIESLGLSPLRPRLQQIAAITTRAQLSHYLGATLRADVDILNNTDVHTARLFGLWVAQDMDDPSHYSPFIVQGGLSMPDRDFYIDDSESMRSMRQRYLQHIGRVLQLSGSHGAQGSTQATRIMALETAIARAHSTRAEVEDVQRGHNHWQRADFTTRAPGMDWDQYFRGAQLSQQGEFVVWQPSALTGISALVASEPLATWKLYLRYHAIDETSSLLPQAFVDEQFDFYGKAMQGTLQLSERWKRATRSTNAALGDAVGQMYVAKYFPPSSKADIQKLVDSLRSAFATRIDGLSWMAPETKEQAKAKLASLKVGIGYPDHWRSFEGLRIVRADAFGNAYRAELYDYRRELGKLSQPVDRGEWCMEPQLVNAVNLPAMNALNFPAAILQPPFYDPARPAAMNFGGIGSTIGHEISHSFDDQGAQFDATGHLRNWWTQADYAQFRASGAKLAKQFDGYRPFPDLALRGQQELSENIADLAGLTVDYEAFHVFLAGQQAPVVDGFSGDQQFFLSYAQNELAKYREPYLRQIIVSDGHAPSMYRADTVRNLDAWYAAFDVKTGEELYLTPEDRVRIW